MDKLEIIQKLFTEEEQKRIIPVLPDQWTKRNRNLVHKGAQDRYVLNIDGDVIDVYQIAWLSARLMHIRLTQILEMVNNIPDTGELVNKISKLMYDAQKEFNL